MTIEIILLSDWLKWTKEYQLYICIKKQREYTNTIWNNVNDETITEFKNRVYKIIDNFVEDYLHFRKIINGV